MKIKGRSNGSVRIHMSLQELVALERSLQEVYPKDLTNIEIELQKRITRYLERRYDFFTGRLREQADE